MADQEVLKRIEALEVQGVQRDREIAELSGRLTRVEATLEAIRLEAPGARAPASIPSPGSTSCPAVPVPPPPAAFTSLIVPEFPALFAEFRGKRFTLLWRGSRDGFGAREFHRRCDGHGNTLTLILDTKGDIFGGFTPAEWEVGDGQSRADPSLKSFLFTLKNPHNFPPRKFALKAEKKNQAIACWDTWGPHFWDISVSDNCNKGSSSQTGAFGGHYVNDTGLDGLTLFTGSERFTVKEIEVFEIRD
jgi:hypothetical protein